MTDTFEEVKLAREQRQAAYDAATLLKSLSTDEEVDQQEPGWEALLTVPAWCYWPEDKRLALAMTAGALFLVPVMRLWIDAERIRQVTQILGAPLFDAVMRYEHLPQVTEQPPQDMPVESLLLASGASILLGSLETSLRSRLSALLPEPGGEVPDAIAKQLAMEAESLLLRLAAEYAATQEQGASP